MLGKFFKAMLMILVLLTTACTPFDAQANVFRTTKQVESSVQLRSVATGGAWSGVLISQDTTKFGTQVFILSIIHQSELTEFYIKNGAYPVEATIGSKGKPFHLHVVKWDPCTELALLTGINNEWHSVNELAFFSPFLGTKLTTVGNPLTRGTLYGEGVMSSKEALAFKCKSIGNSSVVLYGYSGGTISGQTGSPLYNKNGNIVGLLTAVAVMPALTYGPTGDPIGITPVPVYYMGYFLPLKLIKEFLKEAPLI